MKVISFCDGANVIGSICKDLKLNHALTFDRSCTISDIIGPNTQVIQELAEWQLNGFFLSLEADLFTFKMPKAQFPIHGESEHDNFYIKEFCKILERKRPKWFIWEIQPRVIYADNGRTFRRIVGEINAIGYGISWRILDSQFFSSPIKSEKMYVVGHYGSWEETREVLFESPNGIGFFEIESPKRKKSVIQHFPEGEKLIEISLAEFEKAFNLPSGWTKKIKDPELRKKALKNASNKAILKALIKRMIKLNPL